MARSAGQGLQIHEDMRHQQLEWDIERVGWILMAVFVLAALTGLLGYGPVSKASAGAGSLVVEYDRFQRAKAPSDYRIRADAGLARDGVLRLRMDESLLGHVEIDHIEPQPSTVEAGPGFRTFVFDTAIERGTITVLVHYRDMEFGRFGGWIGVEGAPRVRVDQFVYP